MTPRASSSSICRRLGVEPPTYAALTDDPNLHPGRAARVVAGGRLVGRVGELHPDTVAEHELRAERVLVAEVAIAGLAGGRLDDVRTAAPSRHPSVQRDLAIVVPNDASAAAVEAAIRGHGGPLLRSVTLFDIYRGRPLEETEKSLAYRLTLRDDERTLTEAEVDFGGEPGRRRTRGRHRGARSDLTRGHRTAPDHRNPDRTIAGCADGLATCESRC